MDKQLSPSKNAAKYYKKYDKSKATLSKTQELLRRNADRLDYLESISASLETASSIADIDEIEREMIAEKLIKKSSKTNKTRGKAART